MTAQFHEATRRVEENLQKIRKAAPDAEGGLADSLAASRIISIGSTAVVLLIGTTLALTLGGLVGLAGGYYRGRVDQYTVAAYDEQARVVQQRIIGVNSAGATFGLALCDVEGVALTLEPDDDGTWTIVGGPPATR